MQWYLDKLSGGQVNGTQGVERDKLKVSFLFFYFYRNVNSILGIIILYNLSLYLISLYYNYNPRESMGSTWISISGPWTR